MNMESTTEEKEQQIKEEERHMDKESIVKTITETLTNLFSNSNLSPKKEEKTQAEQKEFTTKEELAFKLQQQTEKIEQMEQQQKKDQLMKIAKAVAEDKEIELPNEICTLLVGLDAEVTAKNVELYANALEKQRESLRVEFEKKLGSKQLLDSGTSEVDSVAKSLAIKANKQTQTNAPNPWLEGGKQ